MGGKIIGYGATIERSTDGGTTYAAIAHRTNVAIPETQQDYTEVTDLDSPNGFKEYLPGLKDAGEITLSGWHSQEGYAQQEADQNSGNAIKYKITLKTQAGQSTSGDVFEFSGYPTVKLIDNGLGEAMGMDIVIRTTGDVTYTAGS